MPLDSEAARFYALGIAKLREFDALAAKDLLVEATKADPKFPLAHLMLARAWNQLGYEQKRKEEAKIALDLSTGFPRVDRMQVEGDYYESLPDHEKAASSYRALFELFPDSVEYGLQLGEPRKRRVTPARPWRRLHICAACRRRRRTIRASICWRRGHPRLAFQTVWFWSETLSTKQPLKARNCFMPRREETNACI